MSAKEPSQGKLETRLRQWGAELDELVAKADRELAEVRREYYERVARLRERIEAQLEEWDAVPGRHRGKAGEAEAGRVAAELRARLRRQVEEWRPELERLKARAGQAEAEAKQAIEELRDRARALRGKPGGLKRSAEEAWQDVRTGLERAWGELESALKRAMGKFR